MRLIPNAGMSKKASAKRNSACFNVIGAPSWLTIRMRQVFIASVCPRIHDQLK